MRPVDMLRDPDVEGCPLPSELCSAGLIPSPFIFC